MGRKLITLCTILVTVTAVQSVCTQDPGYCRGDRCVRGNNGAALAVGASLSSGNSHYRLVMQHDGNLVIYCIGRAIWSTHTAHIAIHGGLRFQGDGNLVLYRHGGRAVWNSRTANTEACQLVMQNDGNLVLYGCYGRVIWASSTANRC